MGEYEKKELDTLGTINAVLNLLLGHERSCVFRYSSSQLFYADDGVSEIGPKIELAVQVISLLCGVEYKARRFVEAESA